MPRVPTVNGPSVEDRPLNSPFQRSSVSPAMLQDPRAEQAGKMMMDVGVQLQEREDADTLMRAETELKGKYLEWEGEAKQRKGQQAWGVAKEAGQWWDKEASRISESLSNPRQKMIFEREVSKHRALSVGAFSGHEAAQRRASLDESAQASIVGSINLAAANPLDAAVLTAAKDDILKRNAMRANVNGWAPEVADAKRTEYLTSFHKQVLQGLVRDDPALAEAYFAANKSEIEGSQHAEVGAFAARATAARVGDSTADAVWQTLGPKSDRDAVSLDVMEQALRKQLAGKEEALKAGIAGLRERTTAFKDGRRERDEQLEASVNKAILDGASPRQIRGMPAFLSLSPEAARKLSDFLDNRAVRAEQLEAARASRAASESARADAEESRRERRLGREGTAAYLVYSNPDTLNGMTENQVLNLLPSLGNELTTHLMQQKRQLAAHPGKIAEARMDQEDFNHVGRQLGLPVDKSNQSEDDKALLGEVKYRVEQMISAAQQGGKRTLTRDEKLNMMRDEMARTVKVKGFWSDTEVPVLTLTPQQKARVAVPTSERAQIVEALRDKYRANPLPQYEPTEENIRNTYLLGRSRRAAPLVPDVR
jgi:hypothetical protein